MKNKILLLAMCTLAILLNVAFAEEAAHAVATASTGPMVLGIRVEFILFAMTLLGVALFHHYTLYVALTGLASVIILKMGWVEGFSLIHQLEHEKMTLLNLFGLLVGFALLSSHFEHSKVPEILPKYLPKGWKGGFVLLCLIFCMSSFLDNIAAAMIGGTIALVVFKGKVHIGYLAAIVAASNAGGAGSVVGDTTTTMMWIKGVSPFDVLHAAVGAAAALLVFGIIAAKQQDKLQTLESNVNVDTRIDWIKLLVVVLILAGAILTNVYYELPAMGVWIAIIVGALMTKTNWKEIPASIPGTIFLLSLVLCASMMPVDDLPEASWKTAFSLGFVSAVFDNIPLTALCIKQDGYDWGILAYCVGFGGSMVWFGSSAGVALSNKFPQAKSVAAWLKNGWHVIVAYVFGFFVMLAIEGWNPHPIKSTAAAHAKQDAATQVEQTSAH